MPHADVVLVRANEQAECILTRPEELQRALPGCRVRSVVGSDFGPMAGRPAPRVILLENALAPAAELIIGQIKKMWPSASAVGVIDAQEPSAERLSQLFEAGLDEFICHPIHFVELRVRLRRLLPAVGSSAHTEDWKRSLRLESLVGESK